ncbi:putative cupin superfamily protein [Labrenzia sp. MBR-25]|jgi:uncharacterized cupin superfamily protein
MTLAGSLQETKRTKTSTVEDAARHGLAFTQSFVDKSQLMPAPIRPEWVLEGDPKAMCAVLARHKFGWGDACHWSCTAGKFRWHYGWDESVMFLEGEVRITDETGHVYEGKPGVTLFFPAGTSAVWEVPTYIRKLAFNQKPVPWYLHYQSRILERLKGVGRKLFG